MFVCISVKLLYTLTLNNLGCLRDRSNFQNTLKRYFILGFMDTFSLLSFCSPFSYKLLCNEGSTPEGRLCDLASRTEIHNSGYTNYFEHLTKRRPHRNPITNSINEFSETGSINVKLETLLETHTCGAPKSQYFWVHHILGLNKHKIECALT